MTRGRLPRCSGCATAVVAMRGIKVCFACWPGGPVAPPPCLRCGSEGDYFSSGLCARCHPHAIPALGSCPECLAWGTSGKIGWFCKGCLSWRRRHADRAQCLTCRHSQRLGPGGSCRLCHKNASFRRETGARFDLAGANRHGQQLFFADMFANHRPRGARRSQTEPVATNALTGHPGRVTGPTASRQLTLFPVRPDLTAAGRAGLHRGADPADAAALEAIARDLAHANNWSRRMLKDTIIGTRIVLAIQPEGRAPVPASHVECLRDIDLRVWTVLDVLEIADALIEDRTPAIDTWFATQIDGLPQTMVTELTTWFEVMKHGSTTAPRRRPRSETTINLHLRWALPTLRAWAAGGHTSLREITKEHVLDALPASGNPRSTTGQGLKSIFRLLKARKVVFIDPTARVKTGEHQPRQPMPVDLDLVNAALRSDDPATALLVALIAFHGLRPGPLRRLRLIDISDGRLSTDGRIVPLAGPVRERLAAYLTYRADTWPHSVNEHLFIHRRTFRGDQTVGIHWIHLKLGTELTPRALREDRILNEAHATDGDVRALVDLFGLSVNASIRYVATREHPDLVAGSRTEAPT